LEIDAEISEFAFIILAYVLDGVDVERNQEAVDRRIMVWALQLTKI